ncbi:alpha/beta fold hydrolase [Streptomyces sp. NBC_01465]|uniref:alpha/beta fold hydrolase n=1 Tax=Streptomyces sp. NBC_01465 TaxID=2903878 RepID=UPI002E320888|nr:alpha/beta hydrolase [Streptomyces sp. NBC_01465]
MTQFVLVPGAWLGAWAWDEVVSELREAGHGVHPLTLSGLAEKRDVQAGQQTHVRDIVGEVERLDLRDVVLVGHSYSGIPVGQAAEQIGDRLTRLVLVDAMVPADGESVASAWWSGQAAFEAELAANGGFWVPWAVEEFDGQDLSEEQIARLLSRATPQQAATVTEPAVLERSLGALPATYVKCLLDGDEPSGAVAKLLAESEGRWKLVEMNTGHWPMLSQPHELASVLLGAAVS